MKRLKINPRSLSKLLAALLLLGLYWYWVNQRLISEGNQTFGLVGFFLLMSTATAYFPLPANILVLGAAVKYDAWLVAAVGAAATIVAYLSEYIFFALLLRFRRIANFKSSWLYQKVAPLFDRSKFVMLTFASFLPIPSEPLRIYAIASFYPKGLFVTAGVLGRLPRYFLLAYYGRDYVHSIPFIVGVLLFPAVLLLVIRGLVSLGSLVRVRLRARAEDATVSLPVTLTAAASANLSESEMRESGA